MTKDTLPKRSDVKKEDTWDLGAIYLSDRAWEDDFAKLQKLLPKVKKFKRGLYTETGVIKCLDLVSRLGRMFEKIYVYAYLKVSEDLADEKNNERMGQVEDLMTAFNQNAAFIEPELAQQDELFLERMIKNSGYKDHHFFIRQILRDKKHILSMTEEELLANFGEVFGVPQKIFSKFNNADITFDPVGPKRTEEKLLLTQGTLGSLLENPKRNIRKQAARNMHTRYHEFRNTLAEAIFRHVKNNVLVARTRKYKSTIEKFLYGKAIPEEVYKNLFTVTGENLHLLHRYMNIRKKILGYRELHWYDLYMPLISGVQSEFSYDQAVDMTMLAVEPLGKEYVRILSGGLKRERWVDKYENKGKRSGAFSSGQYDTYPYILHNYSGTLNSVYTLAHEAGHSMHSHYAKTHQPFTLYDYGIFLAEIASTTNEQLLSYSLLKDADKNLKLFIINKQLESIRTTFFRQTMFAEFEAMLYQYVDNGGVLSADWLEKEYFALNQKYYGNGVVIDDFIKSEWSRIPHFYYNFYVYQYATGISCALYFANSIINGGEKERENYLDLLRAGGSDYQPEILKRSGLDVTKPDYLFTLMKNFSELLDEFEKLMLEK